MNAFLKVQQDKANDQFPKLSILRSVIGAKLAKRAGGGRENAVEHPMRLYPNMSAAGVRGADGAMATPSQGGYATAILQTYPHNARAAWGHVDEIKTRQDVQAMESLVQRVTKDTIEGFAISMNKVAWGNGSGVAGRINGTPTVATGEVIVDATFSAGGGYTPGFPHLSEGQWLQATSDKTLVHPDRVGKAKITGKVESTLTATFGEGSIADWADNDYLVMEDGLNNVADGIMACYSSANGGRPNYLSIDRAVAANSYFKPIEHVYSDATSKAKTIMLLLSQAGEQAVRPPSVGLTSYKVVHGIFDDAVDNKINYMLQGAALPRKYAIGFEAVGITSPAGSITEIFTDRHCPGDYDASTGVMAIIEPEDWVIVQPETPGWYKPEGSMVMHKGGTFGKHSTWLEVFSYACELPRRQIFITGLKVKV